MLTAEELRQMRLPVTVMWGVDDRLLPVRHARRAADLLPDAELTVLPGVGHSPNWERPARVIAAIDALCARPASSPW